MSTELQSPRAGDGKTLGDEREACVAWLSSTYPHAWPRENAEHAWDNDHVFALAWRQRAALAAAPAWQPIEGAPQDGRTLLLGYPNRAGKWRTVRGQWMSQAYIDEYWEEPDSGEPGWYETAEEAEDIPNCWRIHPTRYMLLPPAPDAFGQAPATVAGSADHG